MKLFRVLVLVVALVAGGIAAYLALNMGQRGEPPTVVELAPQIQSQDVLVAAADIGQGMKLSPDNVRWQRWPDDAINGNYIQKQTRPDAIQQLQNSIVRSQFVANNRAKLAASQRRACSARTTMVHLPPNARIGLVGGRAAVNICCKFEFAPD
jgi:Flp pilus assembly protein CpaB